jgi:hypothetical protein
MDTLAGRSIERSEGHVMGIDYHREKYGLVALANHLTREGWQEVLLSVRPETLETTLEGIAVPVLDPVRDATDEKYKYNFYIDRGGRIDLVARRDGKLLLVEAKGTSSKPDSGVEQLVGRTIMHMDPSREDRSYAILVPDHPAWLAVLGRVHHHPSLTSVAVFLVSREGVIRMGHWGQSPEG